MKVCLSLLVHEYTLSVYLHSYTNTLFLLDGTAQAALATVIMLTKLAIRKGKFQSLSPIPNDLSMSRTNDGIRLFTDLAFY
jgi:hypothetical protein